MAQIALVAGSLVWVVVAVLLWLTSGIFPSTGECLMLAVYLVLLSILLRLMDIKLNGLSSRHGE